MTHLPVGWAEVALEDVTVDCTQRVPADNEEFTYVDIASVDRDTKTIREPQRLVGTTAPSRARKELRTGDVLVSMTRPNLNGVALVPIELDGQIASTGFDVLRAVEVDPRWLFYIVRSKSFVDAMTDLVQGALYPAVRSKDVRSFRTVLAPLAEQRRIADKLDILLARVDACRTRLDRIPVILKRFRQAVLAAATSGELTRDWREARGIPGDGFDVGLESDENAGSTIPESWQWRPFGDLVLSLRSGTSTVPIDQQTDTPVLRSSAVRQGSLNLSDVKFLAPGTTLREEDFLEEGDLLFTRLSGSLEYVANCVFVRNLEEKRVQYPDRLFRAKLHDLSLGRYVELCFGNPVLRGPLEATAKSSAGHQRISMGDLRTFRVPLPPHDECSEIVRRVDLLFGALESVAQGHLAASRIVDDMTEVLLSKAFRGELVPQDPNDEPASVMLERILAERSAQADQLKRRRRSPKVAIGAEK